ncbi:MAG: alpha/beta hydrolase [Methylococcaceae bacterium]|nr:alpha/beta hydrolase [Methylococcaceae bacterium]MCI0668207.1 alpha/beta hydrolase [Methylococcaceae bacterium]MCI0733627.1 alpha/beta hydrolase [Methylococcaceae bacterium]
MIPDEIELETKTGILAGLEWGKDSDSPFLALHGWLDNAASFSMLGNNLPGCHLIAIDLPGHGKSMHRSPRGSYHLIDYAEDVLNAADAFGWNRFGMIGHSLGAAIASIVAGAVPERITQLILIDGIGPISNSPGDAPKQLRQALLQHRNPPKGESRTYPDIETAIAARRRVGEMSSKSVELLVRRGLRKTAGGYRWRHDRRLTLPSPLYLTEPQVLAFLRSISAPTLLIKAIGGIVDRFGSIERIVSVAKISVIELPGGHHLHLENPLPVAEAILNFLANQSSSGDPRCPIDDDQHYDEGTS